MVNQRNLTEMDQPTINSFRKMYRVERHVEFLTACTSNQVIPKFCKITENVNNTVQMSPREKLQFENRKLSNKLNKKITLHNHLKNIYTQSKNSLSASFTSDTEFSAKVKSIKNLLIKGEKKEDAIRNSKLLKLIHEKSTFNYTKVKLINLTDIFIPLELQELLELGPTNSIGGYVQHEGSDIFFALNALHTEIKKDAREQNNDEFSIEDLRCFIMRTGRK